MKKFFTLALLAILGISNAFADDFALYSGTITEGDYVIVYDGCAMNNVVASSRFGYAEVVIANDKIANPDDAIIWTVTKTGDYYTLYNADAKKYAAGTGAKNKAQLLDDASDDKALWTVSGDATYEFVNKANTTAAVNANLRKNGTYGFACYGTTTGGALSLYKRVEGGSGDTKTATTIKFAEGYKTQIAQGPDGMFPEIGSVVDLPTATVMAGDAAIEGANVDWSIELKSWKEKGEGEKPVIANGKISFEGYGSVVVKASFAGNDKYEASSKTYDLTVYNSYGLLKEMVNDIADPKFEKNDEADKDGKPVFYFFRNIDADGFPPVTSTVTYVNGKYIYLTDGDGNNLLFFGTNSQNLKQGDKISGNVSDTNLGGFWGSLKRYNKLPEFAFTTMNVKVESEGNPVTPATITIDELVDNINNYVKIENAEFVSADKKNLVFKVEDKEFAVYNQFNMNIDALETTAKYTLEGMGSVFYNSKSATGTYQLHLISFDKTGEPTGINSAKVAKTATAIFNVAGQTLSAPQKGLNIIDGKKVFVK